MSEDSSLAWIADRDGDLDNPERATLATVTGCGDCPCVGHHQVNDQGDYHPVVPHCAHPTVAAEQRDVRYRFNTDPAPDWCPLRASPLLVRLRVGP